MTDAEDREAALDRLTTFAQPEVEPTLSYTELEDILDQSIRAVRWTATTYIAGQVVVPTVDNGHRYKVTTGGASTTEPSWPTGFQSTVVTSGAIFEEAGLSYKSLYDVRRALRECWLLKAAKASELISSQDSGSEQMIFEQCQKMASKYAPVMIA